MWAIEEARPSLNVPSGMRIAFALALVVFGCDEPTARAPEPRVSEPTGGELSLHLDSVEIERTAGMARVRCSVRWVNETGGPIPGETCCSGAFDGLTLVATDTSWREHGRVSYLAHQSPYAESVPFTLPRGETRNDMVFLLELPAGPTDVWLRGGVIGNPEHEAGYRSETVRVEVR